MRFLRFSLPLAALLPATITASCTNDQPKVYGFDNIMPFTYPPEADNVPFLGATTYLTDSDISYKTFNAKGEEITSKLKLSDFYTNSTDLETFVNLCEELWILNDYLAQAAAVQGDFDYSSKGLCFYGNTINETTARYFYKPDLNTARATFIIKTCHGDKGTAAERLAKLSDNVETTLALAEDRARKLTFNTNPPTLAKHLLEAESLEGRKAGDICNNTDCSNNQEVCKGLAECYKDQFENGLFKGFNDLVSVDDVDIPTVDDIVDSAFLYSECFNVTYPDLVSKKEGVCASVEAGGCSPYIISNGIGGCAGGEPTQPVCPSRIESHFESYTPDYPNPTTYPSYGVAVASIGGLGFLCKSNDVIDYTDRTSADAVGITMIVKIALQSLQIANEILKDSLPHWFVYFWKIIPYIANAITINIVDTILAQTALHDGLVDGAETEAIYENTLQLLDGSASIYDEVVCRCTKEPRRGQGCDSIDNDCDKSVDEIDEDKFPPVIDASDAYLNCASGNGKTKWFADSAQALACVSTYSSVSDDCDHTTTLNTPELEGTCDEATITLSASDRSGNPAENATVPIFLDEEVPVVSCSVGSDEQAVLYVNDTGAGIMTNVNLIYDATDNCGFEMDVKVDVFANEIEFENKAKLANLFRNGMDNNRVGLYVAAQFCVTAANGNCIKDPKLMVTRVYTIVISASDQAGNAAIPAICQVVIVPTDMVGQVIDPAPSSQRFRLTSYSSTFKDYGA